MISKLLLAVCLVVAPSGAQTRIDVASTSIPASRGSELKRTFFVLNDASCPITIKNLILMPRLEGTRINYGPSGVLNANAPVAAVEVRVLLFDVFGEHLKTLNYTQVRPMVGQVDTGAGTYWLVTDYERDVMLSSIAFVSRVRTGDGKIWRYDEAAVRSEIQKIASDVKPEALSPAKPQ